MKKLAKSGTTIIIIIIIVKGTGGLINMKTRGDHPVYSFIKICQNTEKSPGDLRRLAATWTLKNLPATADVKKLAKSGTIIIIIIIVKGTGGLINMKTRGDHPVYSFIKICQNTEKSPGDLRRLAATWTLKNLPATADVKKLAKSGTIIIIIIIIVKGTGGLINMKTRGDHPVYSFIKICQNTEKSPGDLRRLAVT